MEVQNPYQAPAAQALATAAVPPPVAVGVEQEEGYPELFAPATGKLVVMCLCTFGLYVPYWFYRNWQAVRDTEGLDIWPFWRAVFAPLWSFSSFNHLNRYASGRRRHLAFPPTVLALSYFLLNLVGNLSALFPRNLGKMGWMLAMLAFLPLLPVNSLVRQYQQSLGVDMERQDRLLVWHILIILCGGLLLLLALAGAFLG